MRIFVRFPKDAHPSNSAVQYMEHEACGGNRLSSRHVPLDLKNLANAIWARIGPFRATRGSGYQEPMKIPGVSTKKMNPGMK
jgi:hypothetical protein